MVHIAYHGTGNEAAKAQNLPPSVGKCRLLSPSVGGGGGAKLECDCSLSGKGKGLTLIAARVSSLQPEIGLEKRRNTA